jgi:hypothetical protein
MTVEQEERALTLGGVEEIPGEGKRRASTVLLAVVRVALLLAAGLLSGAVFGAWLVERAIRGNGSFYTELKQLEIAALTVPLPLLGAATGGLGLIYLFLIRKDRLAAGLTAAGVLCFVVGFAVTVWVHFPINAQIMGWSAGAPPADWARVAAEWGRAHVVRTLLSVLGFGLLLASAVLPDKGRRSAQMEAGREVASFTNLSKNRSISGPQEEGGAGSPRIR